MDILGIKGENPLFQLLGTSQSEEVGERILSLVASLQDLVAKESSLNEAPVPAKVYGDIHGQFPERGVFNI